MSHLFKKDLKKYFVISKLFFLLMIIAFFFYGIQDYKGNKFLYLIFTIVSNFLIYFSFRKNSIFFETFFGIFLWLGFWFKFTLTISFTDGMFREGVGLFDYTPNSFDNALSISLVGIIAFILSGYLRQNFFFNYPKKINFNLKKNHFFMNNRNLIWVIFFIFFTIVTISNFYLKIYQKGLLPIYDFNFLFNGTYKWLLLFGLTTISSIIIFFEINFYKKFFFISSILVFFETFLSSFSMLSRGMIFNAIAILFGIYKFTNKISTKIEIKNYLSSLAIIAVLFYISVFSVNYIRANFFYVGVNKEIIKEFKKDLKPEQKKKKKYNTLAKNNSEIMYLLINRWVGIDGVMAVLSKKETLNKSFLLNSFNERANISGPTFYELTFNLEYMDGSEQHYSNVKGNTLPGIIAFIYYSGSYIFLFLAIFTLCFLASLLEYIAFKISGRNLIFASLIGQIIAFRFIHFGYLPHQSYLLFGTIIGTLILVFLFKTFVQKKMIND